MLLDEVLKDFDIENGYIENVDYFHPIVDSLSNEETSLRISFN